MDYLDKLSSFVVDTNYRDLSDKTLNAVRDVTLDTVGAIVAGSKESENSALANYVIQRSGPATSTILGQGARTDEMLATFVN